MPDGYGPDFLSKSMFFREAEAGPTERDLATMTAPFGGSVEQALAFMQNPAVRQRMQSLGVGGFDPNQIRQSPFLPNQFMQHHPGLGGALTGGLANMAATPEAPLVSGAGSGLSRFAQGAYGGPELLRQYKVRQLMAPFQAMGMQLPVMAEQRRQELLGALEEDMNRRRGIEERMQPERMQLEQDKLRVMEERIRQQAAAAEGKLNVPRPTPYGVLSPGGLQFQPGPEGMPSELGGTITGQAPPKGSMQLPGGEIFTPYPSDMISAFTGARYPEQVAKGKEVTAETGAGLPTAKVDELRARAGKERDQGAAAKDKGHAGWGDKISRQYNQVEDEANKQITAIQRAAALPPSDPNHIAPELAQQQINSWRSWLENAKRNIDQAHGAPGASGGYRPQAGSAQDLPVVGGKRNPGLAPGAAPTGGVIPENVGPQQGRPRTDMKW